ncbi:MAG TPA: hypothetical protein V6C97_05540 [Oculatellaceae cyanobacterium]
MEPNKNRDDGPALHESASDTDRQTLFVQPAQRSPLHPKARLDRARGSRDTCGEGVSSRQLQRFDCTTKAHVATTQFTEKKRVRDDVGKSIFEEPCDSEPVA